MLTTSTKLKLAYAGLAAADTWLSGIPGRRAHRARFVTKPLLMPTLAASLVTNPRAADSPLRTTTLAAQVGGWGGDVALLGEGTRPFLAGTGSFALGHVAYLTGFLRQRGHSGVREAARPGSRRVVGADRAGDGGDGSRRNRELGGPVFGYATMLAAMVVAANYLDTDLPRRTTADRRRCGAVHAVRHPARVPQVRAHRPAGQLETAVMATYTAAQFLLSEGAARA